MGAVNPNVNRSPRRYDSEVAMILIHDGSVRPFMGQLCR